MYAINLFAVFAFSKKAVLQIFKEYPDIDYLQLQILCSIMFVINQSASRTCTLLDFRKTYGMKDTPYMHKEHVALRKLMNNGYISVLNVYKGKTLEITNRGLILLTSLIQYYKNSYYYHNNKPYNAHKMKVIFENQFIDHSQKVYDLVVLDRKDGNVQDSDAGSTNMLKFIKELKNDEFKKRANMINEKNKTKRNKSIVKRQKSNEQVHNTSNSDLIDFNHNVRTNDEIEILKSIVKEDYGLIDFFDNDYTIV